MNRSELSGPVHKAKPVAAYPAHAELTNPANGVVTIPLSDPIAAGTAARWIGGFFFVVGAGFLLFLEAPIAVRLVLGLGTMFFGLAFAIWRGPVLARRAAGSFAKVDREAGTLHLRNAYDERNTVTVPLSTVRRIVVRIHAENVTDFIGVEFTDRPGVALPSASGRAAVFAIAHRLAAELGCPVQEER